MSHVQEDYPLIKYCKYHIFGRCRYEDDPENCDFCHDIKVCNTISARKMNAKPKEVKKCLDLVKANPQIVHLNLGRNRLSKNIAYDIASVITSKGVKIETLSLDSTNIGRDGLKEVLLAVSKMSHFHYLDITDVPFMPQQVSRGVRNSPKLMSCNEMSKFHRQTMIESIVSAIESEESGLRHLIIGYNDLSFDECSRLVHAAMNKGLITLDLYGNKSLSEEEVNYFHEMVYESRRNRIKYSVVKCCDIIEDIAELVCEFAIDPFNFDGFYRCHTFRPYNKSRKAN